MASSNPPNSQSTPAASVVGVGNTVVRSVSCWKDRSEASSVPPTSSLNVSETDCGAVSELNREATRTGALNAPWLRL